MLIILLSLDTLFLFLNVLVNLPEMATSCGPRTSRPVFEGKEDGYELWEVKFLSYMRIQKLIDTILPVEDGGVSDNTLVQEKNAEALAELSLCLDDKILTLIFRDAKDEGRKALKILRKLICR